MTKEDKEILLELASIECNNNNPLSTFILKDHWAQIITPNAIHSSKNTVYRSMLDPKDANQIVNEIIAHYRAMKVPFRWIVNPFTNPTAIEDYLIKNDMTVLYEADAMIASCASMISPIDSSIRIKRADWSDINLYVDTFIAAWDLPRHQVSEYRADMEKSFLNPNSRFEAYIAYYNNVPAGTAGLIKIPSGAYLAVGAVEKKFRGKGIYKALLSYRAQRALNLGYDNLLIHAKLDSSQPICKRLGFESVFTQKVYSCESV